ncbi:MAG: nitroreductase family protein [Lachnospiraceae bacterium]|nr:nitroreductase family protein [Lachnospiraceae bacterium]
MAENLELFAKRFSTRGYQEEKLTKALLDQVLTAGLQAPTAANKQEVHFTVVDRENPVLAEIEEEKNRLRGAVPARNFYFDAPHVIFLSADKKFFWSPLDAGIACENIVLAAETLGLGTLIIGCVKDALRGEKEAEFAKKLAFPEGYEYEIAIAIGYKDFVKEPHTYDYNTHISYV